MSPELKVEAVSRAFGREQVIQDITFSLEKGTIGVVVGPSGAGKTTLLNIIAGVLRPDSGRISIGGNVVESRGDGRDTHVKSADRNLGYVFQDHLLFPNMTVFDNVAFGLRAHGVSEQSVRERVKGLLYAVSIPEQAEKRPPQLSGGQRQRVALARALALQPRIVLLDEPLSALDQPTREAMRTELKNVFHEFGTTALYVTHDLDEAFIFGERIGMLHSCRLPFFGTWEELFARMSAHTAEFLGYNLLKVEFLGVEGPRHIFRTQDGSELAVRVVNDLRPPPSGPTTIAIPPESVSLAPVAETQPTPEKRYGINATITSAWELKDRMRVEFSGLPQKLVAEVQKGGPVRPNTMIGQRVHIDAEYAFILK